MKHFLLRIRNQTPDLRILRLDALSRLGELVRCLVASPISLNNTQLTLAAMLAISFFFLSFCVMVRFFINHRNSVWLFVYGKRKLKDLA